MGIITSFLAADIPVNDENLTLFDPKFAALFGSARTFAGMSVSPQKAMRCATVLACVRTLMDDVSKMPLQLFEQEVQPDKRVKKHPALDHSLYIILKTLPNDEMTSMEMRAANMYDLLLTGNFYNQIVRNGRQEVTGLYPLCASEVTKRRDADGNLYFEYSPQGGPVRKFAKDEIWRGSALAQNGIDGQSLLLLVREAVGTLLAAEMQSGRLFSTAAQVNGVLSVPPEVELQADQEQAVLDAFTKNYSGAGNSMKTALLPHGIKYEKIALTTEESQHIERQKFSAEDIVRGFGGGALMVRLGVGEKNATFASSVAFLDDYYKSVLTPYTERIEQSITRDLLLPEERSKYYAKHNHDAILRGDIKSRYEAYGLAIDKGFKSPNDVLELEDENTVDGLDFYHVNQTAVVVDGEIVTVGTSGTPPGAEAPPVEEKPAPVPPAEPSKAEAKLKAFAESAADRVVRAEKKSKKFDAEFVAELMGISLPVAQTYCKARKEGKLNEVEARTKLFALAMETN